MNAIKEFLKPNRWKVGILIVLGIFAILIILNIFFRGAGGTCGGIGGWECPEGYFCRMTGPYYPDKAGYCLPDRFLWNFLK